MNDWLSTLHRRLEHEAAVVRVMVVATRGSVPREAGACMLVGASKTEGTIGGGHLEWKAEAIARGMLTNPLIHGKRLDRFTLGATLGQCCGGVVELWFERFESSDCTKIAQWLSLRAQENFLMTPLLSDGAAESRLLHAEDLPERARGLSLPHATRAQLLREAPDNFLIENIQPVTTPLWLYGAGHVGRAFVQVMASLPVDITWIDNRADLFPDTLPDHVRMRIADQPADEVADAPAHALHLVMTHRHDFDYAICQALLKHKRFQWAGMIGSQTKAASFRARLQREGFSSAQIARLVSPIGINGIGGGIYGKLPGAIAIAAAAQILQVMETGQAATSDSNSVCDSSWSRQGSPSA